MAQPGKKPWEDKLVRSGFFVGAVLFHLVLLALVATWVVFRPPPAPEASFTPSVPQTLPTPPPAPPVSPKTPAVDITPPSSPQGPILPSPANFSFTLPLGLPAAGDAPVPVIVEPAPKSPPTGLPQERREKIRAFVERYRTLPEIISHDPAAKFPVYVASYAHGDWACNLRLDADGNIVAGSIPNLAAKINEWSHGQIRANVVAKPLDIGGPELLAQMPPFIFFTGHKDFVLTPTEVENLAAYVNEGGLIWGDNALAGHGSRFDVAFHREMKRVVPDLDKNFEPVTADAGFFSKGFYPIAQVPQGMNFYSEPLEHLDIDGKLAILYTPNDYSDLYAMRILPGDTQIQGPLAAPNSPLTTPWLLLGNREVYFRNFTLPSSIAVHRLGLNIVAYLLTRFDDDLLLSP